MSFCTICTICKICNHISFFLDILYQIRRVSLEDKSYMYCLWIAKDSEDCTAASRLGTLTLANSNAETIDDSLGEVRINRLSRRKRGMVFNPLFITPDFFFAFSQ